MAASTATSATTKAATTAVKAATVAIVGAGPAGVRAAERLAASGLTPIVLDEAERPGGQIYRQPPPGAERPAADLYGFEAKRARAIHAVLPALGARTDYRAGTLAWNVFGNSLDLLGLGGGSRLPFDRLILATGAVDRVIPFPGWTLPGVFTLGAAQIALKAQGVALGGRVALVGAGPLLPLIAHQYRKAGASIAALLDVTPFSAKVAALGGLLAEPLTLAKGLYYVARNLLREFAFCSGVRAIRAVGTTRVEAIEWLDQNGHERRVACDAIAASFGLRSETQLADLAGCRFVFDGMTRQWVPERDPAGRSSVEGVYLAGDGANIGGAEVAELAGERAAWAVIEDLGLPVDGVRVRALDQRLARQARFRAALERAYPYPVHLLGEIAPEEMVCRCEGITRAELDDAVATKDARDMNRLKAFTRVGMGRCQGRMCGQATAELLARRLGVAPAEVGRLRDQPPVKPIPVACQWAAE